MILRRANAFLDLEEQQANIDVSVRLPELETEENFVKAALTLSSSIDMPELPEASVTATVNRSSFNGGRILANVDWNGGNYSVEVRSDDVMAASPETDVCFFNQQGYELDMQVSNPDGDSFELSGQALIDDEEVGTVTMPNGVPVIEYPDGDTTRFESLM